VLSESRQTTARRSFFLIDQQGIVRQRWFPENEGFFPNEPILQAVRAIASKR